MILGVKYKGVEIKKQWLQWEIIFEVLSYGNVSNSSIVLSIISQNIHILKHLQINDLKYTRLPAELKHINKQRKRN